MTVTEPISSAASESHWQKVTVAEDETRTSRSVARPAHGPELGPSWAGHASSGCYGGKEDSDASAMMGPARGRPTTSWS